MSPILLRTTCSAAQTEVRQTSLLTEHDHKMCNLSSCRTHAFLFVASSTKLTVSAPRASSGTALVQLNQGTTRVGNAAEETPNLIALQPRETPCILCCFWASRALPLEHALFRIRIAAHAACNVRVADMNIDVPISDASCIAHTRPCAAVQAAIRRKRRYRAHGGHIRARLVMAGVEVGRSLLCYVARPRATAPSHCAG